MSAQVPLIIFLSLLGQAFCSENAGRKIYSTDKQWTLIPSTSATTLVGVGASGYSSHAFINRHLIFGQNIGSFAVGAAASNGIGAFMERYDGASWGNSKIPSGLLLDGAITASGQVSVAVGVSRSLYNDMRLSNHEKCRLFLCLPLSTVE